MDTDSEDDIWDYQSLPRTKSSQVTLSTRQDVKSQSQKTDRRSCSSGNQRDFKSISKYSTQPCKAGNGRKASKETKQSRGKSKTSKRSSQCSGLNKDPDESETEKKPKIRITQRRRSAKKKSPVVKVETLTPNEKRAREENRCPVCQFPFKALPYAQSTSWHIDECLMTTATGKTECPASLQCDSTIESHYKKFTHREIYRSSKKKQTYAGCSETGDVTKAKVFLKFDDNKTNNSNKHCNDDQFSIIELSSDTDGSDACTVNKPQTEDSVCYQGFTLPPLMEMSSESGDGDDQAVIRGKKINYPRKLTSTAACRDDENSVSKTAYNIRKIENRDMFSTPESSKCSQSCETVDYDDDCDEALVRVTFENLEGDSLADSLADVIETTHDIRDVSDMLQEALDENRNPVEKDQKDMFNNDDSFNVGSECGEEALDEIDSLCEARMDRLSQDKNMIKIENCFSLRTSKQGVFSIDNDIHISNTEFSESEQEGIMDKDTVISADGVSIDINETETFSDSQRSPVPTKSANNSFKVKITNRKTAISNAKGKCRENKGSEKCVDMVYTCSKLLYEEPLDGSPRDDTGILDCVLENRTRSATANKAVHGKVCNVEEKKDTKYTDNVRETTLSKKQSQADRKKLKKIKVEKECKDQKPIESFFLSKAKKFKVESEIKTKKSTIPESNKMPDKLHQHTNRLGTSQSASHLSQYKEKDNKLVQNISVYDSEAVDSCVAEDDSSNMAGGFFPESEETCEETFSTADSSGRFFGSSEASQSGSTELSNTSSTISNALAIHQTVAEKVSQITKNAADILKASSKLLYRQIAQGSSSSSSSSSSYSRHRSLGRGRTGSVAPRSNLAGGNERNTPSSVDTPSEANEEETTKGFEKRKCPFYKKIPGTYLTVDAFRYGEIADCRAYILSHFHYDHYIGLTKHFKQPIYCSQITANLVKQKIRVDSRYIHPVPLNTPTVVENVEITMLEANHCPGAVLILFKLNTGKAYLHTGDFRAHRSMEEYPSLKGQRINILYLDTTYCDPQYSFPPQEEVIAYTVKLVKDTLDRNPRTLIVCGSYTIGKERIFTAIANLLSCKICVMRDKKNVLDCLEDEWLRSRVSLRWEDSGLHVLPMNKLNHKGLLEHLTKQGKKYDSVLALEPTGWTFSKKLISLAHIQPKVNRDGVKIYGIPYSEHSSFLELKRFVQFTKPDKILPTVNNGNIHSRKRMEVIFEAWNEEAAK